MGDDVSLALYESQLARVKEAIEATQDGPEKEELLSLQASLEELLSLTRDALQASNVHTSEKPKPVDPLEDEYALFKAEMESLESTSKEEPSSTPEEKEESDDQTPMDDQSDDLDNLIGSKCQAPFTNKVGSKSYYNGFICAVDIPEDVSEIEDFQVSVLFLCPTEDSMVPCPFFLENKCRFSDEVCRYSHGHKVYFTELQEYKEPDFSLIKSGCRVFAKVGSLWKHAVVEDTCGENCAVKYQGRFIEVALHDLLPLPPKESDADSDLSSDEEMEASVAAELRKEKMVEMSLTKEPISTRLGEWEKHTKGIGSKLMAKMGYVVGCGLGKSGEGRLEPVQAEILPAGKSLDHCMNLKEAAGGRKDLFSAERVQKIIAQREVKRSQKVYLKKDKEKPNLFNIINSLSHTVPIRKEKKYMERRKLATTTGRELNVERFKIAEDIRITEREIYVLSESLTRQKEGSIPYKTMVSKLRVAQKQLMDLKNADVTIERELNLRDTKKKLTIF